MSRYYEMKIEIEEFDESKKDAIQQACFEEWSFEAGEWFCFERHTDEVRCMEASAQGNLCGGEEEGEFAERISKVIWKANGAFCPVTVKAIYLDELPYESYTMDEEDYAKAMEACHE